MRNNNVFFNQIECRTEEQLNQYCKLLSDTHIVFPLVIHYGNNPDIYILNYRQK